ncbi:MAG: DUF2254 domain-containing protein [Chitinivibrionales bacterium]|nr:DUF2254 domain-containing protein [Chitinivibrionales bacterium]
MKAQISTLWYWLQNSFWFVPACMILAAIVTAIGSLYFDAVAGDYIQECLPWIYTGSQEGARQVMATIAGSIITVAGVVFSITIVALAQASSQFGPRVLRNFMHDKGNQLSLGIFVATFSFCIIVLRSIFGNFDPAVVPQISVLIGVVLGFVSIGFFVFFVHHVAEQLQVDNLIANLASEMKHAIAFEYPGDKRVKDDTQSDSGTDKYTEGTEIPSLRSGYIQEVDIGKLISYASKLDCCFYARLRPGDFSSPGKSLGTLLPKKKVNDRDIHIINSLYVRGSHRIPRMDPAYNINLIVEIAVRALSPAVNSPSTAMICIDWLGVLLGIIARRTPRQTGFADDRDEQRLVLPVIPFESFFNSAFGEIVHFAASQPRVIIHLIDTFLYVASQVRQREKYDIIQAYADRIQRATKKLSEPQSVDLIMEAHGRLMHAVGMH